MRLQCIRELCVLILATQAVWSLGAAEPLKNSHCLDCHNDKELVKTNAAKKVVSLYVDPGKLTAGPHKTNFCVSCHTDITEKHPDDEVAAKPVNCGTCHHRQSDSFGASAHGLALKAGKADAATCVDCHGSHEVLPPGSPNSPLHYTRLAATCGECHPDETAQVKESVHGKGLARGHREAATCTDCHAEHGIEKLSGANPNKIAGQVCAKCHASERLSTKYRLPADRVKTFYESYHGLASSYGSTRAANCASCHGVHNIFPSTDPRSMIHSNNLVKTCGQCHPGATEKFAMGKIHFDDRRGTDTGSVVNRYVRYFYLALIAGTIGLMALHNGLQWYRKAVAMRRGRGPEILRMSPNQRWQHMLLLVSFIALAITGFALKFPDSWLAVALGSNEIFRRWAHRIAGVVMLGLGAYHLVYLAAAQEGRQLLKDLLPVKKDISDTLGAVKYLLGLRPDKPPVGRFGYIEKAEYWAMVWGTIIMGVTGLMLWFFVNVTHFVPRWVLDVATTVHYYEAILACLAIVVWHFYHVIFDPGVYPGNWAFWHGRMPKHLYQEEHPLDPNPIPAPPDNRAQPGQ